MPSIGACRAALSMICTKTIQSKAPTVEVEALLFLIVYRPNLY